MTLRTHAPADRRARILVVDDEPANTLLIDRLLAQQGFENVQLINESAQATSLFRSFEPDLVLLDLHMPAPDGFTLLAEIQAELEEDDFLPILVLTADATEDTKLAALRSGATDFLAKPLQLAEVVLRIENLLHTRSLHEQLRRERTRLEVEELELRAEEHEAAERHAAIERRTQAVIDGEGLTMVLQPIVELATGRVIGAEALARFAVEPERPPDRWFVEAAEVGLGPALELRAIELALATARNQLWADQFLSVNASAATLRSPALIDVADQPRDHALVIELTEHEPVSDYGPLRDAMRLLRTRGASIAIDDTGSGYASMQHLLAMEPDIVKLDRALIRDIDRNPIGRALADALVMFADAVGMHLVAEGIETAAECDTLRELGYDWGQGYALARPGHPPLPATVVVPTERGVGPAPESF